LNASGLQSQALEAQSQLVALRRKLHAVPELGLKLPKTETLVLEALETMPLDVERHGETSGIVAVLDGAGESADGPVVLLSALGFPLPVASRACMPVDMTFTPPCWWAPPESLLRDGKNSTAGSS
jgi:hippurate hydrolase